MSLNAKNAPGGGSGLNVKPLEPATYPGRLVQVIDMGLQPQRPYQGQEKPPAHEIMLTYEFADEFLLDEDGQEMKDKPRWLSESMPLYNLESERARSTQRYNALDPQGVHDGEWSKLVGTPCLITITLNPNKKNPTRPYENVSAVSGMRTKEAERCPPLVNKARVFDLDMPDPEVFHALPKWVKDKITSNLEYEGSPLQKLLDSNGKPAKQETSATQEPDDEDENPY